MNILKSLTFEPALGWVAGGLLAGLLLLLAIALVIHGQDERCHWNLWGPYGRPAAIGLD